MYCFFFLQAEDGIRGLVRSRGLGDVYKRQIADSGTGCGCGNRYRNRLAVGSGRRIEGRCGHLLSLIHI